MGEVKFDAYHHVENYGSNALNTGKTNTISHQRPGSINAWKNQLFTILRYSYSPIKGTVSWELRWVLLYINRKLFSRAIVAHHKIFILLNGYFSIYKRKSSVWTAQQFQMVCTILDAANTFGGCIFIREHLNKALLYSQDFVIRNYATEIPELLETTSYSQITQ